MGDAFPFFAFFVRLEQRRFFLFFSSDPEISASESFLGNSNNSPSSWSDSSVPPAEAYDKTGGLIGTSSFDDSSDGTINAFDSSGGLCCTFQKRKQVQNELLVAAYSCWCALRLLTMIQI